ncbi:MULTISPECIES: TetR/AcrR family transcriptional regulator [unclassified Nocardiopsis]|uniref:TetR/AcrR family transcriptional regulator n=1 Tax=unclassified Nocardiopsis TaxID=2649073 RepID=UPI00135C6AAE|nr:MULTISPECIES: TetR/AcrR family transcriptional regulator [unclassified Nocardiopsis]
MGRTSTARDRLVSSARRLMLTRGYASLGVAEICADADVRKGSFYHFFSSKQALTSAAVDAHWTEQRQEWERALRGPGTPVERLRALVAHLVEDQRAEYAERGRIHGCLYGNLALELSGHEPDVRARLSEVFAEQAALVTEVVGQARQRGELDQETPDRLLAESFLAQVEGGVLLARVHDAPDLLDLVWPGVRRLLGIVSGEPAATP